MITLGLVDSVDDNGVYVVMPGSRGVVRGPYETLQNVEAGDKVLAVTTDDGINVIVGLAGASIEFVDTSADAGSYAGHHLRTGTERRWFIGKNNTAESGSDAGSNFIIWATKVSDAVAASVSPPKLSPTAVRIASASISDVGPVNVFHNSKSQSMVYVPEGTPGDPLAAVQGIDDAMDRITQEILNRLAQRKLLVVWLFDESESMQDGRAEISARVQRVYQELKLSATADGDAHISSVMSYGANVSLHTKQPTSDHRKVEAAIAGVPNDPSGKEMMCRAIQAAVAQHQ